MRPIIKAFFTAFLFSPIILLAEWVSVSSDQPTEPKWIVNEIEINEIQIDFTLPGYNIEKLKNGKNKISFPGGVSILESGAPDLPLNAKSIMIPNVTNMKFSILESEYIEIEIEDIIPSKGNLTCDRTLITYFPLLTLLHILFFLHFLFNKVYVFFISFSL